ncbi:hypothetical protein BX070DRAFT_230874 [Coemansia spiralis]|nr:hypothetical protein BX070DRAFT_230874 [Coemansia spiralis]
MYLKTASYLLLFCSASKQACLVTSSHRPEFRSHASAYMTPRSFCILFHRDDRQISLIFLALETAACVVLGCCV